MRLHDLPERLLKYKDKEGLSYAELGKAIGVSKAVAYDICMKRRRFLDLAVLSKILKLIGD